jgi:hypothetical protein
MRLSSRLLLLLALGLVLAPVATAAPTPADLRACVEHDGTRYQNPGSAVVAQYADAVTACQAAFDDHVSVQLDSGAAPGSARRGQAPAGPASGPPSGGRSGGGSGAQDPGAPASGGTGPASPAPGARGPATAAPAGGSALVGRAIRRDDAAAGSPVPASLSDGPAWMYGLLGGVALLIVGAVALAVTRRPR